MKHSEPVTQEACKMVMKQTQRMVSMAQELLDFAKGSPSLTTEILPVSVVLKEFKALNKDLFEKSKVQLTIQPIETKIMVDPDRISRVFQNLATNAVEAMTGKEGTLHVSAREDGKDVEICVADNGPGIPEAIRDTIFEPFVTHGKKTGTGLGMAIVKMMVEAHKGHISFKTESGKGTSFLIRLPKYKPEQASAGSR